MKAPCEICMKFDKENKTCASEPLGNAYSIWCKEFAEIPKVPKVKRIRVKPKLTSKCVQCIKFDEKAKQCTLEPFEGRYESNCPEADTTKSDKQAATVVKCIGVLFAVFIVACCITIADFDPSQIDENRHVASSTGPFTCIERNGRMVDVLAPDSFTLRDMDKDADKWRKLYCVRVDYYKDEQRNELIATYKGVRDLSSANSVAKKLDRTYLSTTWND